MASVGGVAVVVKSVGTLTSRAVQSEFENEVRMLIAVTHPHALEYVGVTVLGSDMAIVTEYVAGGDLMDRIEVAAAVAAVRKSDYGAKEPGNPLWSSDVGAFPLADRHLVLAQVPTASCGV